MDSILSSLHRKKGVEAIIAVVKRLEGGDCYEFGMELGRIHKVGKKSTQSGLIVVLSTEDRGYHILPGRGLEGVLPDAICKRIEERIMVPYLKEAEWDSAMLCTIRELSRYIETEEALNQPSEEDSDGAGWLALFFISIFTSPFVLALYYGRKQCPQCKKRGMKITSKTYLYTKGHYKYYKVCYKCPNCLHTESKIIKEEKDDYRGGHGGFIGGGGFSSHGGGFSGGSFGGGSFSGGGAGGRF